MRGIPVLESARLRLPSPRKSDTSRMDEWLIDLFRFNLKFIDGNVELDKE